MKRAPKPDSDSVHIERWLQHIGRQVRTIRAEEKQEFFAKRIGVSRKTLSNIENGHGYGIDSLIRILLDARAQPTWLAAFLNRDQPSSKPHALLHDILEEAPQEAVDWIVG